MRVAVTGGTGYAGPAVVTEMLREGHAVVALEHARPLDVADAPLLVRTKGDVTDRASLDAAFAGCDAVVHLVAILREDPTRGITFERLHVEATRNVVDAARAAGVGRILLMSANGVGDPAMPDTPYFATKARMEETVRTSGLAWTIFRPSYIAGARPGGFDAQFAAIVDRFVVLPSFGGGRFEIQPVSRRNVGEAFARAVADARTHGKTYTLVGPERMTWNEYLRRLSRVRGKRRLLAYAPGAALRGVIRVAPALLPVDVTADQLRMLMAGNVGDPTESVRDLRLDLEPWESAVRDLAVG